MFGAKNDNYPFEKCVSVNMGLINADNLAVAIDQLV